MFWILFLLHPQPIWFLWTNNNALELFLYILPVKNFGLHWVGKIMNYQHTNHFQGQKFSWEYSYITCWSLCLRKFTMVSVQITNLILPHLEEFYECSRQCGSVIVISAKWESSNTACPYFPFVQMDESGTAFCEISSFWRLDIPKRLHWPQRLRVRIRVRLALAITVDTQLCSDVFRPALGYIFRRHKPNI